jgi:hypothetical protein
MLSKFRALVARVPVPVRVEAQMVTVFFATAFLGSFVALLPGVAYAPNFTAARAALCSAVVGAFTAAVRATKPVLKASLRKLGVIA